MNISTLIADPLAVDVTVSGASLRVTLDDGREVSAPIEWFPRLRDASDADRADWRFIGRGEGIHWPAIDEDISVEGLLAGRAGRSVPASISDPSLRP